MKTYNQITTVNDKQYLIYETLETEVKEIIHYKSGWGNEYRKVNEQFGRHFRIEETQGRSSATFHPFVEITFVDNSTEKIIIAYSGNWSLELEKTTRQTILKVSIEGGYIDEYQFIPNVYRLSEKESVNDLYTKRSKDQILNGFPVSYNHWWSYEDQKVNEKVILENAKIAKELGAEYVILDAGWFGSNDEWMNIRGDWDQVNSTKFPNGIKKLSDQINDLEMKFGIWVEIEAIGKKAQLRSQLFDYIAEINDEKSDLLCFGNKEVVEWAYQIISGLIDNYNAEWIKMDFNIDPQSGCKCENHGHDKQSGNQAHVGGLYALISRLQIEYPNVIFENCSSGGQRSDQQIIDLFDVNFLSDADYIEHKSRCFYNSKNYIPNYKNYHFIPSMTLTDYDSGFKSTDYRKMDESEMLYNLVPALYGVTGISHRLIDYSQEIIDYLKLFFKQYNKYKKDFLSNNEPIMVQTNEFDLIYYQVGNEYLCGIMSHTNIQFDLDSYVVSHEIMDLITGKKISSELDMNSKQGKLLLIKGE